MDPTMEPEVDPLAPPAEPGIAGLLGGEPPEATGGKQDVINI